MPTVRDTEAQRALPLRAAPPTREPDAHQPDTRDASVVEVSDQGRSGNTFKLFPLSSLRLSNARLQPPAARNGD